MGLDGDKETAKRSVHVSLVILPPQLVSLRRIRQEPLFTSWTTPHRGIRRAEVMADDFNSPAWRDAPEPTGGLGFGVGLW